MRLWNIESYKGQKKKVMSWTWTFFVHNHLGTTADRWCQPLRKHNPKHKWTFKVRWFNEPIVRATFSAKLQFLQFSASMHPFIYFLMFQKSHVCCWKPRVTSQFCLAKYTTSNPPTVFQKRNKLQLWIFHHFLLDHPITVFFVLWSIIHFPINIDIWWVYAICSPSIPILNQYPHSPHVWVTSKWFNPKSQFSWLLLMVSLLYGGFLK